MELEITLLSKIRQAQKKIEIFNLITYGRLQFIDINLCVNICTYMQVDNR